MNELTKASTAWGNKCIRKKIPIGWTHFITFYLKRRLPYIVVETSGWKHGIFRIVELAHCYQNKFFDRDQLALLGADLHPFRWTISLNPWKVQVSVLLCYEYLLKNFAYNVSLPSRIVLKLWTLHDLLTYSLVLLIVPKSTYSYDNDCIRAFKATLGFIFNLCLSK